MATTLTPYRRGVNLFDSFRNEMEDLLEKFFAGQGGNGNGQALKTWAPQVDVEETDKEILVKADLPGVDPKDIEIQIADNVLTLSGSKEEKKEEKEKNYHRTERFFGKFYRSIPLPAGADTEKVSASCANGTVIVTIPKRMEAQPKKIEIKPKG